MSKSIDKEYLIHFPDFFRTPVTNRYKAETASKAKYLCYLRFSDAYDMTFGEFLKIIKVWKYKGFDSTEQPEPYKVLKGSERE
jgi:hypothetical protein